MDTDPIIRLALARVAIRSFAAEMAREFGDHSGDLADEFERWPPHCATARRNCRRRSARRWRRRRQRPPEERRMLKISDLAVRLEEEDKTILKGVNLEVPAGKVHAIMGPNGSGKSTLSYVLAGRDGYEVTAGAATLDGEDILDMDPEGARGERALPRLPVPGRDPGRGQHDLPAHRAERAAQGPRRSRDLGTPDFLKLIRAKAKDLAIDADMLKRPVNVGFSGGEKKRNEILQMAVLEPQHVHPGRDGFRAWTSTP